MLVLFLIDRFRAETVALSGLMALGIASFLGADVLPSLEHLWAGYSSNAVMSLIAVMFISVGLQTAGIMENVSQQITKYAENSEKRVVGLLMITAGLSSAVMQNAAVVALFLPVATVLSRNMNIPMGRLAMPLAIGATAGGTMTLVSTAPLILVEELIPVEHKAISFTAPFFTGLAILICSVAVHLLLGHRLLPRGGKMQGLNRGEQYRVRPKLRGIMVDRNSRVVGRTFGVFERGFCVTVAAYSRDKSWVYTPTRDEVIPPNCIIAVFATDEDMKHLLADPGIDHCKLKQKAFAEGTADFVEMLVPAGSKLAGQRIRDIKIRKNYGFAPLVISSGGKLKSYNLRGERLREGDMIYGYAEWAKLKPLYNPRALWLLGTMPTPYNKEKAHHAIAGLVLALLGLIVGMPSSLSFGMGAAWMVCTRLFNLRDVIHTLNWPTVALLGAMIPIGASVSHSGAAEYLAAGLLGLFSGIHFFELCLVITLGALIAGMAMTNVGAATVMIPLAAQIAVTLGLSVNLLSVGVALAVSNTFMLAGSQVNAFIQASGDYKARDYIVVGSFQTISYALIIAIAMYLFG